MCAVRAWLLPAPSACPSKRAWHALTDAVLAHLQAADRNAAGIGCLAVAKDHAVLQMWRDGARMHL